MTMSTVEAIESGAAGLRSDVLLQQLTAVTAAVAAIRKESKMSCVSIHRGSGESNAYGIY